MGRGVPNVRWGGLGHIAPLGKLSWDDVPVLALPQGRPWGRAGMGGDVTRPAGPDEGASKALGQFLQQQSRAAGLTAREIEERFRLRADQEQAQIAGGQAPPADPVSSMNFSKSHLDRLFKGATSPPS